MDSYNTERVDISRGANAILFGLGSPAGIINNQLKTADLRNASYQNQQTVGRFGSHRVVTDLNQPIRQHALAFRLIGVHDTRRYRQDPAYERDQRLFATAKWEPKLVRHGLTQLQVSYEMGDLDSNRPRITPPHDGLSVWYNVLNKLALDLENERSFGMSVLAEAGLKSALTWEFTSFERAMEFIEGRPARYVFKLNGHATSSWRNYVGQAADGGDVIALLMGQKARLAAIGEHDVSFVLMEYLQGVETGVGAYFNGELGLRTSHRASSDSGPSAECRRIAAPTHRHRSCVLGRGSKGVRRLDTGLGRECAPAWRTGSSWCLGPLWNADLWQASPPTLAKDRGWHASLIAFPGDGAFWLTSGGQWLKESTDILEILEERIAPSARVLVEMNAGPGRLAAKLSARIAKSDARASDD